MKRKPIIGLTTDFDQDRQAHYLYNSYVESIRKAGGVPLLICRRADDTFVLRELDEAQFVSLLVERSNPVLDMATPPAPGKGIERPAGEGWSGNALSGVRIIRHLPLR